MVGSTSTAQQADSLTAGARPEDDPRPVVTVRLIGTVGLTVDGSDVACRGLRESALLARLAIDVGVTVTRDRLLDDVWTEANPGSRNTLRVQMWRLRSLFEAAGAADVIETRANGYALVLDRDSVDLLAIIDRINAATVAGDEQQLLSDAEWVPKLERVRLLEGLEDFDFALNAAVRFERLVVSAHHQHARALLAVERFDAAIEVLTPLVDLDQRATEPAALLMRALRLVGRRYDALQVAVRHRSALTDVGLLVGESVLAEERRSLDSSADPPATIERPIGHAAVCDQVAGVIAAMVGRADPRGRGFPSDRRDGSGLVCLSGEAGVGKSFVLDWLSDDAERRGARVVRAAGDRFESAFPLAVLRRAFAAEGVTFDEANDPSLAPDPPTVWQRTQAKDRVVESIAALLDEPLALMLDDLHWADETSLVVLRGLAALAQTKPLTIIAAGRPVGEWRRYLTDIAEVSTVVEPLDIADSRRLAAQFVGADLDSSLEAVVDGAQGLPLLIVELLRGLASESRLVTQDESLAVAGHHVPRTFRDVVQRRVAELSDDAIAACRSVSTIGPNATTAVLAGFLDRAPLEVAADVDEAISAGLLKSAGLQIEFRHDLVRQAFDDTVTDVAQAEMHRHALDFWSERGAPLATLAAHAVLAGGRAHDAELVSWLTKAADLSGSLEPASTLDFLDKALATTTGDVVVRYEIQRARVEALTAAGRSAEAMDLLESVIGMVPDRRPEAVLRLAGLRILANDLQAGLDDIARVIDAPGASDDVSPAVYARLVALSAITSVIMLDSEAGRPMAQRAAELGERCGDAVARSIAASALGRADAFELLPTALPSLQLAVEFADADATRQGHAYQPLNLLALTALDFGDHAIADRALVAGEALQEHLFAPWTKPLFDAVEMTLAYRRADFDGAVGVAERLLYRRSDVGAGSVDAWAHAVIALVAVRRDQLDVAAAAADDAELGLQTTPNSLGTGVVVATRAVVSAACGDIDVGFAALRGAWDFYEGVGVRRRLVTFAAPLVLLALVRDDRATAGHVATVVGELASTSKTGAHRALALRLRGLADDDVALLEQSAALARQVDHLADAQDAEREIEAIRTDRTHRVIV